MPNNDPITRIFGVSGADRVFESGDKALYVDIIARLDQEQIKVRFPGGEWIPIIDKDGKNVGGVKKASGTITRANDASSGTQAITGLGFMPSIIHFIAQNDGAPANRSMGFSDGVIHASIGTASDLTKCIDVVAAGNGWTATIQSLDADGFTVDWGKVGNGLNVTVKYIAIK